MNNQCPLCGSKKIKLLKKGVRDNSNVDVMVCEACSLEFLSDFSHVTDEFYQEGEMHQKELFYWLENTKKDDVRRFNFLQKRKFNKKVLDFGAGNGNFVKLAQCEGVEIDNSLRNYFKDNNLKIYKSFDETDKKYDYITLFHVLEHMKQPEKLLEKVSEYLQSDGKIIVEVPSCDDALLKMYRSKDFAEFTYWGCHLYLYNEKTLKKTLKKAGFKVCETH